MPRDQWPDLCRKYQDDDRLPVRKVGPWTEDKLYFWNRYIDITTRAMVGHPKWPAGLAYVDLFAGPGVCQLEDSGKRIPGSTLIAAHAAKAFREILAVELEPALAHALETRLKATPSGAVGRVFAGDCNSRIGDVIKYVPARALTLAFVDPENLNVEFSTVQTLAGAGQVDLLILFADRMDLVRNVDRYEKQPNSVLDRMMGPHSQWRNRWSALANRSADNICRLFADEYKSQLERHLGYQVFGEKVMRSARGPLYRLIFASKNPTGLQFWEKVTRKDRGGQPDLPF